MKKCLKIIGVLMLLASFAYAGNVFHADVIDFYKGLQIGQSKAEDVGITFKGNAVNYALGLKDSDDTIQIVKGTTLGTTPIVMADSASSVVIPILNYVADSGTANAYVATLSPAIASYNAGLMILFKAGVANTTISNLNVNSLGTKAILKLHDQSLISGDIEANSLVLVVYDGTQFQMLSVKAQ